MLVGCERGCNRAGQTHSIVDDVSALRLKLWLWLSEASGVSRFLLFPPNNRGGGGGGGLKFQSMQIAERPNENEAARKETKNSHRHFFFFLVLGSWVERPVLIYARNASF